MDQTKLSNTHDMIYPQQNKAKHRRVHILKGEVISAVTLLLRKAGQCDARNLDIVGTIYDTLQVDKQRSGNSHILEKRCVKKAYTSGDAMSTKNKALMRTFNLYTHMPLTQNISCNIHYCCNSLIFSYPILYNISYLIYHTLPDHLWYLIWSQMFHTIISYHIISRYKHNVVDT